MSCTPSNCKPVDHQGIPIVEEVGLQLILCDLLAMVASDICTPSLKSVSFDFENCDLGE